MPRREPPDPLTHPPGFVLHVHHFLHYPHLEAEMAKIATKLTSLEKSVDESIARVMQDVEKLRTRITGLEQDQATDEDLARLDAIQAKLDALDPEKDATLPSEPSEPAEGEGEGTEPEPAA
jgi:hypothetical protein